MTATKINGRQINIIHIEIKHKIRLLVCECFCMLLRKKKKSEREERKPFGVKLDRKRMQTHKYTNAHTSAYLIYANFRIFQTTLVWRVRARTHSIKHKRHKLLLLFCIFRFFIFASYNLLRLVYLLFSLSALLCTCFQSLNIPVENT